MVHVQAARWGPGTGISISLPEFGLIEKESKMFL